MRLLAWSLEWRATRRAAACLKRADELDRQGLHEAAGAMRQASTDLTLAAYIAKEAVRPVLYAPIKDSTSSVVAWLEKRLSTSRILDP